MRHLLLASLLVFGAGCEKMKLPERPPAPDVPLPPQSDAGSANADAAAGSDNAAGGDASAADKPKIEDPKSPIGPNLLPFLPETLGGVRARKRQEIKSAPIVHAFYVGEKRKAFNVHISGPTQKYEQRIAAYPLLGKDGEKTDNGGYETVGLKIGDYVGQRTYDTRKKKCETVLFVNEFVEVKVSVQPAAKAGESTKLVEELDLAGLSELK